MLVTIRGFEDNHKTINESQKGNLQFCYQHNIKQMVDAAQFPIEWIISEIFNFL